MENVPRRRCSSLDLSNIKIDDGHDDIGTNYRDHNQLGGNSEQHTDSRKNSASLRPSFYNPDIIQTSLISNVSLRGSPDERRASDNETLAYRRQSLAKSDIGDSALAGRSSLNSASLPSSPAFGSRSIDILSFVNPNKSTEFSTDEKRSRADSQSRYSGFNSPSRLHSPDASPKISNAAILGRPVAASHSVKIVAVPLSQGKNHLQFANESKRPNEATLPKTIWTLKRGSTWFSLTSNRVSLKRVFNWTRYFKWNSEPKAQVDSKDNKETHENWIKKLKQESFASHSSKSRPQSRYFKYMCRLFVRWYSLRNALALANVIILVCAVTIISVIANITSKRAAEASMMALSEITLRNVQFQLQSTIGQVEQLGSMLDSAVRLESVSVAATSSFLHLLFDIWNAAQSHDSSIENLYVATSDGYFASVGQLRDVDGRAIDGGLLASYINSTTVPTRYYLQAEPDCIAAKGWKCLSALLNSNQISYKATYNPVTKTFYQYASIAQTALWTNIYVLGSGTTANFLGLTLLYPYFNSQALQLLLNPPTTTNASTVSSISTATSTSIAVTTTTTTEDSGPTPASDDNGTPQNYTDPSLISSLPALAGSPSDTNSSTLGITNITVVKSNGDIDTISSASDSSPSSSDSISAAQLSKNSLSQSNSQQIGVQGQTTLASSVSPPGSAVSSVLAASAVTATDISLAALSSFLQRSAAAASGSPVTNISNYQEQDYDILIYVIEYPSLMLVATSQPENIPLMQGTSDSLTFRRQRANDSNSSIIQNTWSFIQMHISAEDLGASFNTSTPNGILSSSSSDNDNDEVAILAMLQYDDGVLVLGAFDEFSPEISWLIVVYIPYSLFQRELGIRYTQYVLATCIGVGICSVLLTIYMTRKIAKPIKLAAQKMLKIADLDFEVLGSNSDDSSDSADSDLSAKTNDAAVSRRTSVETAVNDSRRGSKEEGLVSRGEAIDNTGLGNLDLELEQGRIEDRSVETKNSNKHRIMLKEIAGIENAMSSMTSGLKSFLKYVPIDVVQLLVKLKREAVLGVDEMPLTIMFTDIADFTSIAENITPTQLVKIMSEYLEEMSDIIIKSQGVVDKYIGDAIMAFWNAPLYLEDHPRIACRAALLYQQRLAILRGAWKRQGLPEIHARIGINTGLALVGNVGSKHRINYTCLGDTVNLASRFENLNKRYGTSILISEFTYKAISSESASSCEPHGAVCNSENLEEPRDSHVSNIDPDATALPQHESNQSLNDEFLCRVLDTVAVKGKTQAVRVYELMDTITDAAASLIVNVGIWNESYEHYCQGNFELAERGFHNWITAYPEDRPGKSLLSKCKFYISNPPKSAIWSPVVILDEK